MANTVVGIRFKAVGKKYYFDPKDFDLNMYDKVVVETVRGFEMGEVIEGIKEVDDDELISALKPVQRIATEKDIQVILNELVRRINEHGRRLRSLENRNSILDSRMSIIEDSLLKSNENVKNRFDEVLRKMEEFETEHGNLRALAGIGQVVNSTLELDSVLEIVMDTIVRLTGAERGFLMLRDEQGDMTSRVARNWEQESINPNEFAVSRTIIKKVIEDGNPILTTNAQ